jgi:hypothetical protein
MNYYISRGGQQYGPYSTAQLQSMKAQGQVADADLAWGEGMAQWTPLSQVLASAAPAAQAQPQYTPQPQQQAYTPQQQYAPQAQQSYTPQAQQQYTPQPQYTPQQPYTPQAQAAYGAAPAAAPAYAPQAYTPGYAPQPGSGPTPPNLHWIIAWFIAPIWAFVEASFVKKIDPQSKGMKMLIIWFASIFGAFIVYIPLIGMAVAQQSVGMIAMAAGVLWLGMIAGGVCGLIGMFNMRRSIENYYNTVEPIGLKLSGVMTFFFNIVYFQYHFSRIAAWKTTGRLS